MATPFEQFSGRVRQTWSAFRPVDVPMRVLRESWPRVLPRYEAASALQRGAESPGDLLSVLAAFDELAHYQDEDTLLRRTVELLRSAIGLERCAIFLLDAARSRLCGTWGTGANGETTDERHIAFDIGPSHREAFALAQNGSAHWTRFAAVPLFAQANEGTRVLCHGDNVVVPIPGRLNALGAITCDWALSQRAVDTEALLRAALLTRVFAAHWERLVPSRLGEATTTPTEPCRSATAPRDEQIALGVVAELRRDPTLHREQLGRRLGVTPGRLGRAVKAALGESLGDYKNRLRLQRFFAVVDPGGGNLLPAALDAGFGSYAQFHRVFHKVFRCSPIEYLRGGTRPA